MWSVLGKSEETLCCKFSKQWGLFIR